MELVDRSDVPTTGFWRRGSTVINNAWAAGEALYWVCTVSGEPGTWVPVYTTQAENVVPTTTVGVGAKAGATVSVVEGGEGIVHKTTLTLASTPVEVVSVTTGNGVGGTKIYDFPAGRILALGCMGDLSIAIAAAKQGDFTDATPEGDVGIGTVAPANADALGTDATDDDFGTAKAFTMSDYAATADVASEPVTQFDGTGTAKAAFVNLLIDAADIDNDATTEVLVSGTVTLHWINLGDF